MADQRCAEPGSPSPLASGPKEVSDVKATGHSCATSTGSRTLSAAQPGRHQATDAARDLFHNRRDTDRHLPIVRINASAAGGPGHAAKSPASKYCEACQVIAQTAERAYRVILDNFPRDPLAKFMLNECEESRTADLPDTASEARRTTTIRT
jgi:hypothetical protein